MGYQGDRIANTYYAQAREYNSELGRFTGEDSIEGDVEQPFTINQYIYCWSQPINFVDMDGNEPIKSSNLQLKYGITANKIINPKVEIEGITNIANGKEVSLGKGWQYRYEREPHPHIHLYKKMEAKNIHKTRMEVTIIRQRADRDHQIVYKRT